MARNDGKSTFQTAADKGVSGQSGLTRTASAHSLRNGALHWAPKLVLGAQRLMWARWSRRTTACQCFTPTGVLTTP